MDHSIPSFICEQAALQYVFVELDMRRSKNPAQYPVGEDDISVSQSGDNKLINRPGVAGAVLQRASLLIDSLSDSFFVKT